MRLYSQTLSSRIKLTCAVCLVGFLAWSCSKPKKQDTTQIRGAGERFHAVTVRTNDFDATSVYKAGTHGQPIWAEWDLDRDGNPDTTTFSFEGKNIATVYSASNKPASFDFSFYGSDGKLRTLWMARAGSDTFTDRITYGRGEPRLERFVNGKWELVIEREQKRGVLSNGHWFPILYTNGSWRISLSSEAAKEE